jgi:outer membrane protein assembly factor BamA
LISKLPRVGGFFSNANASWFVDAATVSMEGAEAAFRQPIAGSETRLNDGDLYLSSGISITLPPVWSQHRVRLDFPVFLNKPLPGDNEFEFRFSVAWIIGNSE